MDKKLVLFVDDDLNPKKNVSKKSRETLHQMVEKLEVEFEVVQAYSLNSALEKIKIQQFDVAVVDILIPLSDDEIYSEGKRELGLQLIKELTENYIPVVAITNKKDVDRDLASKLMTEYLVAWVLDKKLDKIDQLISTIKGLKPNRRLRCCSFHHEDNEICLGKFKPKGTGSVFVISSKQYEKDAQEFSDRLLSKNFQVDFWVKDPDASARTIFCNKTCPRIYENKVLAANISDLNCNVFFEIGFALGIGRLVFFMFKKDTEQEPGLKILKNISWNGYKEIKELIESFESTIETNEEFLKSNKVYETPEMFEQITPFNKPENREKKGKYLASYDNSLITDSQEILKYKGIIKDIVPINLSNSKKPDSVAEKLISAKSIIFFLHEDLKNSFSDYRINNAELMFFAGLCVAQGVPVRIITDSHSPDFEEISISPSDIKGMVDFVLKN